MKKVQEDTSTLVPESQVITFESASDLAQYVQDAIATEKEHNGWTNYATWRVNLEMVDAEQYRHEQYCGIYELSDVIRAYCEDEIGFNNSTSHFAFEYALAFMSDVNWYAIAEAVAETYPEIIVSDNIDEE